MGLASRATRPPERGPYAVLQVAFPRRRVVWDALGGFEPHHLGCRERGQGQHIQSVRSDPEPDPDEESQIDERRKHHPLHRELLDARQEGPVRTSVSPEEN